MPAILPTTTGSPITPDAGRPSSRSTTCRPAGHSPMPISTGAPTGWPLPSPGSASPGATASACWRPTARNTSSCSSPAGGSAPSCCRSTGGSPCRSSNTSWATRRPSCWFTTRPLQRRRPSSPSCARSPTCSRSITTDRDSAYERALASAAQPPAPVALDHDDIAMVMYTSGTTGHPKGAIITHGMNFWNCVNLGIPALITPRDRAARDPAAVPYRRPQLLRQSRAACRRHHPDHAHLRPRPGARLPLRSRARHHALLRRAGALSVHDAASEVPGRRSLAPAGRRRRRRALCARHPRRLGRARRAAGPGLGHDRDQPGRHDARRRRRHPQGGLGRQGADAYRHPHRRRRRPRRGAGRRRRAADQGPQHHAGLLEQARRRRLRPSPTAGCTPATPRARTRKASSISSIAGRTCTSRAARTSIPPRSRTCCSRCPQVADAAIIGVPNERWGEVGMAIIVRKPDQDLEEGDVIRHCLGRLAKFKVPQSVVFVDVAAAQRHRQGAEARAARPVRRHGRAGDQLGHIVLESRQFMAWGRATPVARLDLHHERSRHWSGAPPAKL